MDVYCLSEEKCIIEFGVFILKMNKTNNLHECFTFSIEKWSISFDNYVYQKISNKWHPLAILKTSNVLLEFSMTFWHDFDSRNIILQFRIRLWIILIGPKKIVYMILEDNLHDRFWKLIVQEIFVSTNQLCH